MDIYATVEEVIASESRVSIISAVDFCCHFLVCDVTSECATVEMIEGAMVYRVEQSLPVDALTNSTYDQSVAAWRNRTPTDDSLARFNTAASAVTRFQPSSSETAVAYAFDTLERTSNPTWTVWSLVFDPSHRTTYFRTRGNPQIRRIDLGELDFTCGAPVLVLDIHAELSADVNDELQPYSHQLSLDHFAGVTADLGLDASRVQIKALLRQMELFPCAGGEAHIGHSATLDKGQRWLLSGAPLLIFATAALLATGRLGQRPQRGDELRHQV